MEANPYSAPTVDLFLETPIPEADLIRKQHIGHEVSLKTLGVLYLLGGLFVLITAVPEAALGIGAPLDLSEIGMTAGLLAVGVIPLWAGLNLRKLRRRARIPAIVLAGIGLFGFPVGTIISLYFLYLLLSKKGALILSDSYQDVIAATPHIRHRTSKVVWIALMVVLLLFGLVIVSTFLS